MINMVKIILKSFLPLSSVPAFLPEEEENIPKSDYISSNLSRSIWKQFVVWLNIHKKNEIESKQKFQTQRDGTFAIW